MKQFFTETMIVARLAAFRVACYFFIPFCTTFLALTESWSGKTWDETHPFLIGRLIVSCTIAGITSLVAYIDSSSQKAKEAIKQSRDKRAEEEQTQILRKLSEPGPVP